MSCLNRRQVLKFGAALPLAVRAINQRAGARSTSSVPNDPPRRIIFICNSLGFYAPHFFPSEPGDLSTAKYLNEISTKDKVTVFQNLFHPGMETSNHDSEKSFLTGTPKPEAPNFVNHVSVDQLLATAIGADTRFPFLPLSIYDRGWGCSWNSRGVAIPPMHDESQVFQKLFGDEDLTAKRRQLQDDRHIIQCLYRDLEQLRAQQVNGSRAGSASSQVDTYRTVIAELEKQLTHEQFWINTEKPKVQESLSDDPQYAFSTKLQNLLELSKLAFQTDSTRVITLTMDWIYGAINVPGATGGWHTLSHHGEKQDILEKLTCVEVEIMRRFDQFVTALDHIPEGTGSLLDYTTVVLGSNFGDASNHTCNNLPTIVAGGGHQHQFQRVLDKPTPLCNLWLELLNIHNIDVGKFGSSTANMNLLGT